jgi:hypothetical protein
LNGSRRLRTALAVVAALTLLLMVSVTLTVCLLLSSAFTAAETALWALAFLQSVAMQVLVTNTIVSLATLTLNLACSWVLLRVGRRRQREEVAQKLKRKKAKLADQVSAAAVRCILLLLLPLLSLLLSILCLLDL